MQKKSKLMILIALFLSGTVVGAESILIPTYNTLFELFPGGTAAINFIMTGCYAVAFLLSLLIGQACRFLNYKTLLTIAASAGTVSGICTFLFINPVIMAVMRGLMMLAYTFSNTVVILYITRLYPDSGKRGKILGYYVACQMAISAVFAMISGVLATHSLRLAYSLHFLIVLYLAAVILFVPNDRTAVSSGDNSTKQTRRKGEKLGKTYWSMLLNFAFFNFSFCLIFYYTSVYVAENCLGTEALSGTLNAVCTGCSFVVSFLYGGLTRRFGSWTLVGGHISAVIGCLLLWLYPSVWSAVSGIALISFASGFMRVYYYDALPAVVPESRAADSVAFLEAFQFLMTCVITYIVTAVMSVLHIETFTALLPLPILLFAMTAAAAFVFRMRQASTAA